MANFVRKMVAKLAEGLASDYETDEDDFNENQLQPGDPVDVEVGDRVKSIYGTHWVTDTGTVNGLWTSERKQDIATGQGRGLKLSLVKAVLKPDADGWIQVKYSRDAGSLVVVDPA